MPDFESSLNEVLINIFNSITKYEEKSLKSLSNNAITATEAHILEAIAKAGESVTVSDIAAALNVALPTATVALKKLEGKGLITRAPCADDGRRSLISLTEHGAKLNKAHAYFHKKLVQGISSGFTEEEKEILLTATEKLYEYFKEKADNNEY